MTPLIVWEGGFGRAVVRSIARARNDITVIAAADFAGDLNEASHVAFVSWRWSDATALRVADAARAAARPLFLVQLDGRVVVLGPLFGAEGPCYRCFRGRYLAQAVDVKRRESFWRLFAADDGAGVPGFTPSMVRLAGAATLAAFEAREPDPTVRCFDVLSGDVTIGELAAIHTCAGPHGARKSGPDRFVTALETLFTESHV